MAEKHTRPIADVFSDHDLITAAINRAVRTALLDHARAGRSVPVARNGDIVWLSPADILARYGAADNGHPNGAVEPK